MFNIGGGEVLVILMLILVVLGPDKLPEAARSMGKHLSTVRRLKDGFQAELRDVMDPLTNPSIPHDAVVASTHPLTNPPSPHDKAVESTVVDSRLVSVAGPSESFR